MPLEKLYAAYFYCSLLTYNYIKKENELRISRYAWFKEAQKVLSSAVKSGFPLEMCDRIGWQ